MWETEPGTGVDPQPPPALGMSFTYHFMPRLKSGYKPKHQELQSTAQADFLTQPLELGIFPTEFSPPTSAAPEKLLSYSAQLTENASTSDPSRILSGDREECANQLCERVITW